jgi:hypothetical protein
MEVFGVGDYEVPPKKGCLGTKNQNFASGIAEEKRAINESVQTSSP